MPIRVEKSCPIPQTHNRLRQMHDLWHEMQVAYPHGDDFVTRLNACIQAGRSVTFVLQKEVSKEPWFDAWYGPWRERMRADRRLRWLVEARNTIEKEGDLATASIAVVSLLATDYEEAISRIEVPALASPDEVAATFRLSDLPERIRAQTVLAVERRWTVPELADDELLDTLAYCYGLLASIVAEAHQRRGYSMRTFSDEDHSGGRKRREHPSSCLPCMVSTAAARTAYWHLGAETLLQPGVAMLRRPTAEEFASSSARYGFGANHLPSPTLSVAEQARMLHGVARRMLETDGCHHGIALLISDDGGSSVISIDFDDQQDKIVKIRQLAREVDEAGAVAVIFTAESWFALAVPDDDPRAELRASERDDRRETLVTYLLRRGEKTMSWYSFFEKDAAGSVVFNGETIEVEQNDPQIFRPVLGVWERWDRDAA